METLFGYVKSESPINNERLCKQSTKLLELLCKNPPSQVSYYDAYSNGIGTPHSRFAEVRKYLKNKGIVLHDRYDSVINSDGDRISFKRFWIDEKDILILKK